MRQVLLWMQEELQKIMTPTCILKAPCPWLGSINQNTGGSDWLHIDREWCMVQFTSLIFCKFTEPTAYTIPNTNVLKHVCNVGFELFVVNTRRWWTLSGTAWQRPKPTRPATFYVWKTRGCQCSFMLLVMGGVSSETCWASYKYGIIKFWYMVASCWISFMNCTMMHGSTNINACALVNL
jgi:hypothetical protein